MSVRNVCLYFALLYGTLAALHTYQVLDFENPFKGDDIAQSGKSVFNQVPTCPDGWNCGPGGKPQWVTPWSVTHYKGVYYVDDEYAIKGNPYEYDDGPHGTACVRVELFVAQSHCGDDGNGFYDRRELNNKIQSGRPEDDDIALGRYVR